MFLFRRRTAFYGVNVLKCYVTFVLNLRRELRLNASAQKEKKQKDLKNRYYKNGNFTMCYVQTK